MNWYGISFTGILGNIITVINNKLYSMDFIIPFIRSIGYMYTLYRAEVKITRKYFETIFLSKHTASAHFSVYVSLACVKIKYIHYCKNVCSVVPIKNNNIHNFIKPLKCTCAI